MYSMAAFVIKGMYIHDTYMCLCMHRKFLVGYVINYWKLLPLVWVTGT